MGASLSSVPDSSISESSEVSLSDLKSSSILSGKDGFNSPLDELVKDPMEWDVRVEDLKIHMVRLKPGKGLTHKSLLVTVSYLQKVTKMGTETVTKTSRRIGYIKAEKWKDRKRCRGIITLSCPEIFNPQGLAEKRVCMIQEDCGMIPMRTLIDILEVPNNSGYDPLINNCWKYAEEMYRRLIKEFSELPKTTSEAKQRLQSYLANLPPVRLPGYALDPGFHGSTILCTVLAETMIIATLAASAPAVLPLIFHTEVVAATAVAAVGFGPVLPTVASYLVKILIVSISASVSVASPIVCPQDWIAIAVVRGICVLGNLSYTYYHAWHALKDNSYPEQDSVEHLQEAVVVL